MLYYKINYYYNRLFIVDDKYYIYVYVTNNNHIYKIEIINNLLFLFIINKNTSKSEKFSIKVMYENKELLFNIHEQYENYIKLGTINDFKFKLKKHDNISINNEHLDRNFLELYPNFDIHYYIYGNKFINGDFKTNDKYIKYHWYLCGQYQPQFYFKYLLRKHSNIILALDYSKIQYDENKKNTLLFIDDRYDPSFLYLCSLFIWSVDLSWNITIFTTIQNKEFYENDFAKLKISGKINILEKPFKNMIEYSQFLTSYSLWETIKEDNCLTFQYDSFCMGKFNEQFFDYNYIGARWKNTPCLNENINIGNGGTSFRKTRIFEMLCKKYKNRDIKKYYVEDIFFAELLYDERFLNCTEKIADLFSFENIYNEHSIYAHQIYNTIKLSLMDDFMYNKLIKMKSIIL